MSDRRGDTTLDEGNPAKQEVIRDHAYTSSAQQEHLRNEALLKLRKLRIFSKKDDKPIQVIEHVYIGSVAAAKNRSELKALGITHIVNASPIVPCFHKAEFEYLCVDIHDCATEDISPHFHPVASFIHEGRLKGGVLVHCYAGVSRSAALLAGYLILRHSASLDSAVQMLRAARPSVDPNPGFRAALRRLEATCRESGGEPADRDGLAEASEAPGCPSLSEDGERGGQRGVAEAGPVGESVEEQRRAALERMEALIQSRGVFVGRARVRAAAGGERECAEGWRVGGRRCTEIVVWKGGQLAAGVHGDATLL